MKKIFMLAVAAVLAISVTAADRFQNIETPGRSTNKSFKTTNLQKGEAKTNASRNKRQTAANAPESITGKSFITVYHDDTTDKFNNYFTVVANDDKLTLEGFAEGLDVEATYDAATGTITIPTGMVIGNHSTYGDITLHALDAANSQYIDEPIIGIVDGNKVTFNYGVYATVVYQGQTGGIIWMEDIDTNEANAKMSFTFNSTAFECPLYVTKTADNALSVVGMNILFTSNNLYSVPVSFDATTKVATIKSESPIGHKISTNGTGVKNIYYMFARTSSGLSYDPSFNITAADNVSTLSAGTDIFLGYDTNGAGTYSGYSLSDFKLNIDFDLFTKAVEEDPYADPTSATVDAITYNLDNETKTAEVTGCLGSVTDLNIPSSITVKGNVYTVTSVAETAFYANRTLKIVRIPASMKSIGQDAFRNLSNLNTLYIEDLTAWCAIDFYNGNANPLYNVFPSLKSKWGKVYINGTETTDVIVPEGITKIGRSFYGFKSMTSVTLPSTLKEIGDQAFANCISLTGVTIPESVEKIGSSFWSCEGLTEISIPGSVKTLAGSSFYSCKNLKSISIAEGLKTIGRMTFYGCKALEAITLPSTVTTIEVLAFMSCTNIKEITSLNTVPPTCASDGMFSDFLTAKLLVPAESIDDYKAATSWKEFTNIEGISSTGINGVENDDNISKEYYNLQGMKVAAENVTPGIYIIREGSKTTKAYVNAK